MLLRALYELLQPDVKSPEIGARVVEQLLFAKTINQAVLNSHGMGFSKPQKAKPKIETTAQQTVETFC